MEAVRERCAHRAARTSADPTPRRGWSDGWRGSSCWTRAANAAPTASRRSGDGAAEPGSRGS